MRASGVYEIAGPNGSYVGSAANMAARWTAHRHTLRTQKKSPLKLQRAWDKYGGAAFVFRPLLVCNKEALLFYEQRAIRALAPRYNTRLEAHSNIGVKWSAETNRRKAGNCAKHEVCGVFGSVNFLAATFGVVSSSCAAWRVQHGWSVADAVTTPPADMKQRGCISAVAREKSGKHPMDKPVAYNGEVLPLRLLVKKYSTHAYSTVQMRVLRGWEIGKALTHPLRIWP